MPLSASLVASIVGAVIETIAQSPQPPDAPITPYDTYVARRALPPEAKVGFMRPIAGNGLIVIDDKNLPLSPVAQFRNQKNLIVMPMTVQRPSNVIYINNNFGSVHRVWLIGQAEADALRKDRSD
ncbi:MAG: hypothetical protein LBD06_04675 [Candidatus Accumulibacter sp.]|jgi:hypothetical protein|nr:hypothetical protein [Accumulibacter sp.]